MQYSTLTKILVSISCIILALTLVGSNGAPQEAAGAAIGCFFGMMARISQAEKHNQQMSEYIQGLRKEDNQDESIPF